MQKGVDPNINILMNEFKCDFISGLLGLGGGVRRVLF